MPLRSMITALALALAGPALSRSPCGIEGPACAVPLGTYRLALPDGPAPAAGFPAVLFFHGHGGSGAQTLSNTGMVDTFLDRGWAVVAPDGLRRPGANSRPGWSFMPFRQKMRDEAAFTREVLDDAAARDGIDRDRILLAGFSSGGSLTLYLACADPSLAAAFAPVAGSFWRPYPEMGACAGPVRLLYTHGWRDETLPLEGAPSRRGGEIQKGDVFRGLEIMRDANGCTGLRADEYDTDGAFWRRWWTRCTPGSALQLALHAGGHSVPPDWAALALDWFAKEVPESPD